MSPPNKAATRIECAHFLQAKWSATKIASLAALIGAIVICATVRAAPSEAGPQQAARQQQQVAASATSTATAAATSSSGVAAPAFERPIASSSGAGLINRRLAASQRASNLHQQQELESIRNQLLKLESEPSDTLSACARWYNLNLRHDALLGSGKQPRESESRKRAECDTLDRFYAETRAKLTTFKQLLGRQTNQLDFAVDLVNEYLDLNYAASVNAQLADEIEAARNSDSQTRFRVGQLEQFVQFMASSLDATSAGASEVQQRVAEAPPSTSVETDELGELDRVLKQLINRETTLSAEELAELADLGNILERILADGNVDLSSGRFRYLLGTLDAAHAVIVHRTAQIGPERDFGGGAAEVAQPMARSTVEMPRTVLLRRQARGQRLADSARN